jgi:hypothetical protein
MKRFLTIGGLDDKMKHTNHIESNEQHKFARLANTVYYYEDQEYVQEELFSYMNELSGFELDTEFSTEEHSIFHDKNTKETIISYRGTTNLKDVETDSHIAVGNEQNTERYKKSDDVFKSVSEKYGKENVAVTGHSLGGGISTYIAEKYDVQGHHYNPAISPTQVFSKDHHNNTNTQNIYRTKIDPVSVGGEVIGDNQKNRTVITVGNNQTDHAHALTNFYDNKAKRNQDGSYSVKKESLYTTVARHKTHYNQIYDAYEKVSNIDKFLDNQEM